MHLLKEEYSTAHQQTQLEHGWVRKMIILVLYLSTYEINLYI